ncbi:MAG: hypothetical protein H0T51_09375 [Pirellulales bacterium]|nr:hypothetical protein [Pirellulales bacterium]
MSASTLPFEIPRPVAKKVSRLRLLVRLYSLAEGLAAVAIVIGIGFWLGLAIDWLLEPRLVIRVALAAAVGVAALVAAWRYIGRRALAPLPDDSLALLVERQYPELDEGLVTTVQATGRQTPDQVWPRQSGDGFERTLMEATGRKAANAVRDVRLRRVFDMRPLAHKAVAALALLAAIGVFAVAQREAFAFWIERIQLSEQLWPRRVRLSVVGFEDRDASPVVNVARDDDFELNVLASILDGHTAPEEVEIRWRRPSDGGRGGGPMLKIGSAVAGRDDAQQYSYTFKVSSDLEFDVIGGDDRVRNLRLHAVERPAVTRVWLEVEYPEYMRREPRSIPVSGRAEIPEGARAVCRIEANKPLASVEVRDSVEQSDLAATVSKDEPSQFSFPIEPLAVDRVYMITMHDADGVENRDPFRLPLSVLPDEAPELSVQLRGIGSAVTPQATIPLAGRASDDYGLEEVWFDYQIDDGATERRPLRTQPDGMDELPMTERFDLAEADPETRRPRVALMAGQKLTLAVKARDAYDLADEPHIGGSQRFLLDVVTPSELRALLEKRELGLRQRFEQIYERMVGVRELLDRIDLAAAAVDADDTASEAGGDAAATATGGRVQERDRARIGGAQQSTTQLSFETAGVAEGFDDIVAELINNRVDTDELKERLEQGISEPLKEVSGELLPRFEQRLAELLRAYETDAASAAEPLAAAKSDADAALEAMKAVLDRMLELESYNELVELLRGIVADQEQIKQRTQEQQREKLRGLLDE